MNTAQLKYALTARACSPELADEICAQLDRLAELESKPESQTVAVPDICRSLFNALSELHAMVVGECPSLLDEDSGGDSSLDMQVRNAIGEYIDLLSAPATPAAQVADDVARDAVCVGRARFPRTGGNVGISWYVEDALGETNGHRSGAPKDGELLFVLSAAQAKVEKN